jgi:hypothetical protein
VNNEVRIDCSFCGNACNLLVPEMADEQEVIHCGACGKPMTTTGKLHAMVAQQALGLGVDDLSDDHVPVGGAPFGETT